MIFDLQTIALHLLEGEYGGHKYIYLDLADVYGKLVIYIVKDSFHGSVMGTNVTSCAVATGS